MVVELLRQSDDVLVSSNDAGVVGVARELKELTIDLAKVVVQPEPTRAKLATCARTVQWCAAVARLRQGRLEGGSD